MDFEFFLVFCTFLTGIVWLADLLFLAKRRQANSTAKTKPREPWYVDYSRSLFPIFLIVMLFRSFIYEPFRIPSPSLEPTLLTGDFILVNKYDYGVRLPVLHNKVWENKSPKRGDIVVFRWPVNPKIDYIKRVIGVPGDRISYIDKELWINGKPAKQEFEGFVSNGDDTRTIVLKDEDLIGIDHQIYQRPTVPSKNFFDVVVPPGKYFVMGDNRDDSSDSRVWGFVPEENLVGKAVLVWMSWDGKDKSVRFDRIGQSIH